ncbi:hypothetical protein H4582DRAFT_1343064 [Lactarius indigo]|nr:hypothetical protein H4582DRAFT_1343064 [Lactarius indigo]
MTLGGPTTLTQKMAKVTRMAGYLTKTPENVAAIVRAVEMAGVDRTRVQTGAQPTLDAKRGEHSNSWKGEKQCLARGGYRMRSWYCTMLNAFDYKGLLRLGFRLNSKRTFEYWFPSFYSYVNIFSSFNTSYMTELVYRGLLFCRTA